ncbi:MAG: GNAT family N-acetyltransferase, partial [Actinomycetota bacterium]
EFVGQPRDEPYGRVVVFVDVAGNRWDLLGPDPGHTPAGGRAATSATSAGSLVVRRERPDDEAACRAVLASAFAAEDAPGVEPVEARLLDGLRRCEGWLPALSWVAELDGVIVGHNVATRGSVGDVPVVGLGPIGIAPHRQRTGIGSALMAAMIGAADATGEPLIGLLGSPDYYRRFGFVASTEVGIEPPDPAWGPFFQVRTLSGWRPSITGSFQYASPFDELD